MPPSPRDDALVLGAIGGDRSAFGALIERYGADLRYALEGRTQDPEAAADLAQETWVRVAKGLSGFHVGQRFRPWLFAVGFNALRDYRRRLGVRAESSASMQLVDEEHGRRAAGSQDSKFEAVDEREAIGKALAEVDEPFRSALRLVDVLGLDYGEAALALDCAEGTVKSRLSRGRRAFRASYARLVGEAPSDEGLGQLPRAAETIPSKRS